MIRKLLVKFPRTRRALAWNGRRRLLEVLVRERTARWYGLSLAQQANVGAATLYPVLARLEREGILLSEFEEGEKPRRRMYWVNPGADELLRRDLLIAICCGVLPRSLRRGFRAQTGGTDYGGTLEVSFKYLEEAGINAESFLTDEGILQ